MNPISRKKFLQSTALLYAAWAGGSAFTLPAKVPRLSFSTLGCPDWSFEQITAFAQKHRYQGLEIRGIQRQMDLPQCPEFSTEEARKKTAARMQEKGLQFVGLGSSANLHQPTGAERDKNLAEARRFIDLAQQISCPYIRVFPNNFPKDQEKEQTMDLIVAGLKELGEYARGKGVKVLMETHGDVVYISDLVQIMRSVNSQQVGLVWDVTNMWVVTKEPPAEAFKQLQPFIHHVHIKDAKLVEGKPAYTFLGEGEVPIFEGINALAGSNYKGFYSFEWEKLWHPNLPEPEIALAHYPAAIAKHFRAL